MNFNVHHVGRVANVVFFGKKTFVPCIVGDIWVSAPTGVGDGGAVVAHWAVHTTGRTPFAGVRAGETSRTNGVPGAFRELTFGDFEGVRSALFTKFTGGALCRALTSGATSFAIGTSCTGLWRRKDLFLHPRLRDAVETIQFLLAGKGTVVGGGSFVQMDPGQGGFVQPLKQRTMHVNFNGLDVFQTVAVPSGFAPRNVVPGRFRIVAVGRFWITGQHCLVVREPQRVKGDGHELFKTGLHGKLFVPQQSQMATANFSDVLVGAGGVVVLVLLQRTQGTHDHGQPSLHAMHIRQTQPGVTAAGGVGVKPFRDTGIHRGYCFPGRGGGPRFVFHSNGFHSQFVVAPQVFGNGGAGETRHSGVHVYRVQLNRGWELHPKDDNA